MQAVAQNRNLVSLALAVLVGTALLQRLPFPEENNLLQLVLLERPYLFFGIKWTYVTMLFTTPYIGLSLLFSLVYIFIVRAVPAPAGGKLPPYPDAATRDKLFLVVGELHHPRRPEPAATLARGEPEHLVIAAIASHRRYDKHNPQYYAEHTVRKAAQSLKPETAPARGTEPER